MELWHLHIGATLLTIVDPYSELAKTIICAYMTINLERMHATAVFGSLEANKRQKEMANVITLTHRKAHSQWHPYVTCLLRIQACDIATWLITSPRRCTR